MRRRLTLLVAATTSAVLIAFLVPFAAFIGQVAENRAVDRALLAAQSLTGIVGAGDLDTIESEVQRARAEGFAVTVYLDDGTAVGVQTPRSLAVDHAADRQRSDIRWTDDGGRLVLQPVVSDQGLSVVQVAVAPDDLQGGVTRARGVLLALGLALFAGSIVVAHLLARNLTRPLRELSAAAERLGSGDLGAHVVPSGTEETREVGVAMNLLAGRIEELLAAEREQVADLSHRLRTPVTVLRLDAESLQDATERERLSRDVEELTRHIDDVIRGARRAQREGARAECDAAVVVRERVEFWRALADDQGRGLELRVPSTAAPVRLDAEDLAAALDALLGNALSHTPEGADVLVTVGRAAEGDVLVGVEDAGPGLPFDGTPVRGDSRAGSTGLGLDIAARTAAASGGRIEVGRSAELGGAAVRLHLAPPA